MHRSSTLKLLVCLLLGSVAAQKKGGGGGGGSGGSDSDNDGSSGDGGNDDSDDTDDSSGGDSSLPDNSPPCGYFDRLEAFGLPGLYYNGTLTIRHHITHNSAWDDEDGPIDLCDNDDRSPKTYTYPALVLIAPTGNESDTNPMHWVLRGFQPAHEYNALPAGEVDFKQRWVYIRSSDFVITNYTQEYDTVFSPYRTNRYRESDATKLRQTTRVYWPTNVTSEGNNVFSAHAEYAEAPPILSKDDYTGFYPRLGKHTSQYVTLRSVCRLNQKGIEDEDDIESVRGTGGISDRRQIEDKFDENGERIWYSSNPTFWLDKGMAVEMAGIGADQMTLTLNNTLKESTAWIGQRDGGCSPDESEPFEFSEFYPAQSSNHEGSGLRPWNVTVSLSMSFEGSIVRENSTTIDGSEAGKLLFGAGYRLAETAQEEEKEESAASRANTRRFLGLALAMMIGFMSI
ncbi:hypothetical protein ACHAQA_005798 [Verticillium albo-atrum]